MKIIEINLLPPEYAPESPLSLRNVIMLILSFLVAGFLAVIAFQMLAVKESYMRENARLLTTISNFRREKERLDALLKRESELKRRYEVVEKALGVRETWSDKLAHLWNVIPEGIWIQDLSVQRERTRKEEGWTIKMRGYSSELEHIERLIRHMEEIPYVENPIFSSIQRQQISAEHDIYRFEVQAEVNSPAISADGREGDVVKPD